MRLVQSNPAPPKRRPDPCKTCGGKRWILTKRMRPIKGPNGAQQTDVRAPCPDCTEAA